MVNGDRKGTVVSSDFAFKIILIGNPAVGKTSLIIRYIDNKFRGDYIPTLGTDFLTKKLELLGARIRLMIWDMGGQDKWFQKRARFMKGSDGAIIVYSNADLESYRSLNRWVDEVYQFVNKDVPIIFVRNKMDLPAIQSDLVPKDLMKGHSSVLIETSAKTGNNVEKMFKLIASGVVKQKAKEVSRSRR